MKQKETKYLLIVNAAYVDRDVLHIKTHIGQKVTVKVLRDRGLLALQGPMSATVLERYIPNLQTLRFLHVRAATLQGRDIWISRSGYTGEDGFEISVRAEESIMGCSFVAVGV